MKNIFKLTLTEFKALKPRPEMLAFAKSCDGDMRRFWNHCPNGDWLLWLLQKTQNFDELKARKVALAYAKKVLPVFEKINPFDKKPRRCVRAIESFIKHPTVANQKLMMNAAYEIYATHAAYAAASAIYHAARYYHAGAAANYAVHFATAAADEIQAEHSFTSTIDADAREKFARWGANKIRTLIPLK